MEEIKGYFYVGICKKCGEDMHIGNAQMVEEPVCVGCGGKVHDNIVDRDAET